MSEVTEAVEHAEHMQHMGHADGRRGKLIGLTIGCVGVLVALCAATVSGERNEICRAMVGQTQVSADATAAGMKFRIVMIDIENLRSQPAASLSDATRRRFLKPYSDYSRERKITGNWVTSYQPLINLHFDAAEGYEHARLIAEIAIVIGSLAAWRVPFHASDEPICQRARVSADGFQD